jgi:hypothetical protein
MPPSSPVTDPEKLSGFSDKIIRNVGSCFTLPKKVADFSDETMRDITIENVTVKRVR